MTPDSFSPLSSSVKRMALHLIQAHKRCTVHKAFFMVECSLDSQEGGSAFREISSNSIQIVCVRIRVKTAPPQ